MRIPRGTALTGTESVATVGEPPPLLCRESSDEGHLGKLGRRGLESCDLRLPEKSRTRFLSSEILSSTKRTVRRLTYLLPKLEQGMWF